MKNLIYLLIALGIVLNADYSEAQRKSRKTTKKASTVADVLSRYKDKDRGSDVRINKFTKIIPNVKTQKTVVVRNTSKVKPPSSMKFFINSNQKEAQLEKILDDQINELYTLSQKFRKSPERGEIWLRLGELYVEKAKLVQYRIQGEFDKKIQAWEAKGRKGRAPKVNMKAPQVYNRKAMELYSWYIKDFPKSRKLDQAYFFMGYNNVELGNWKAGTAYYERLTKQFPRSIYITEARFATAEFYFDNSNWKKAAENYKSVLKSPKSRIYPFAVYKLAWCHYRLGQPAIAINYLEKVIELSEENVNQAAEDGKVVNRIRLADEAYNDLILFYPDVKAYQSAADYFERMGGEKRVYSSLEKLGYSYSDRGHREAARYVFGQLIDMNPDSPKNFDFQFQIVKNYAAGGSRQTFREELFNWITNYNSESSWASANPKEVQKSFDTRESTLRGYILNEHKALQKSRNATGLKLTRNLYELYVKEFDRSKNAAEMRFFYGELLYDMKEFENATAQYRWVVQHAPNTQYYELSMINIILSLEKRLPSEAALEKVRGTSLEPFEFNEYEREFVAVSESYTSKFPKAEKALDIRFKTGRMYYSHNYFDQALAIFNEIVKQHPRTKTASYSANLILDIYNLRKDYEGLSKAGQALLATPGLKSADANMDIKDVVEKARFKEAQDLEGKKDFTGSAKAFENFTKMYPRSGLASIARYNAGINYERAGDLPKAVQMYNGFLNMRSKENESQRKEARRLIGRIYERTGQLKRAAQEFEKFTQEYPKDALTSDLYFNTAVIYTGFKDYTRAIRNYEKYMSTSNKPNKVDAIFLIGEIEEKRNRLSPANAYFEKFINSNPRDMALVISAAYKIAKNADKARNVKKADEWYKKVISLSRRAKGGIGARRAAEAQFRFVLPTLNEMKAIRIPRDPKGQGPAIQKKLALINKLNKELESVVRLDVGEYVVAALTTAGEAYEHISDAIYKTPLPKGLNAEQIKIYKAEVDKVAGPLKKQAIDNYRNAVGKASQVDGFSEYTIEAHQALARLEGSEKVLEEVYIDYEMPRVNL